MLTWALIAILGATLLYRFTVKRFRYWIDRGVKQKDLWTTITGSWEMSLRKLSLAEIVQNAYNIFPQNRYSGTYQFLDPTLVLRDPELIKQISVKDFDHFTDHKSVIPEDAEPLLGKNLLALKGEKWRDMRTVLSPSFTSSKMKTMFVLIKECAENFIQHFQNKNQDIVTIEYKDTFTRFTNDVIATTAFGIKVDSLGEPNNELYLMGKEVINFNGFWDNVKIIGYLIVPKLFRMLGIHLLSQKANDFFNTIVGDTIKVREEKGIVRPDMINLLLEARKGIHKQEESGVIDTGYSTTQETSVAPDKTKVPKEISIPDIVSQAMVFFVAGFDTVSGLMCFTAYELAANPEIQNKLRQEVRSTLEECNGNLTYEGLLKMKYMDMVISEVLRKWPVTVATERVCTKPYTIQPVNSEEKPVHLSVGDPIWFPIFGLHRDPQYFPNPDRFDPERFSDENKDNIKPYTYFPFGLGPRICIGARFALLETKTLFFHILNSFELVPGEKSTIPLKISKDAFNLSSEGGFWFGLKRIKS